MMMNNKFSISKQIDVDILDITIQKYINTTGEVEPYLFMNRATINALMDSLPCVERCSLTSHNRVQLSGMSGRYCGYKVFEDNTLDFGSVEIR